MKRNRKTKTKRKRKRKIKTLKGGSNNINKLLSNKNISLNDSYMTNKLLSNKNISLNKKYTEFLNNILSENRLSSECNKSKNKSDCIKTSDIELTYIAGANTIHTLQKILHDKYKKRLFNSTFSSAKTSMTKNITTPKECFNHKESINQHHTSINTLILKQLDFFKMVNNNDNKVQYNLSLQSYSDTFYKNNNMPSFIVISFLGVQQNLRLHCMTPHIDKDKKSFKPSLFFILNMDSDVKKFQWNMESNINYILSGVAQTLLFMFNPNNNQKIYYDGANGTYYVLLYLILPQNTDYLYNQEQKARITLQEVFVLFYLIKNKNNFVSILKDILKLPQNNRFEDIHLDFDRFDFIPIRYGVDAKLMDSNNVNNVDNVKNNGSYRKYNIYAFCAVKKKDQLA